MHAFAIVSLLAQDPRVEFSTPLPESGVAFAVRALDEHGRGAAGAQLELRDATDRRLVDLVAAVDGTAEVTIAAPGAYVLVWHTSGLDVLVPFHVVAPQPRSALALWTVPLGLLLGWSVLRHRSARPPAT